MYLPDIYINETKTSKKMKKSRYLNMFLKAVALNSDREYWVLIHMYLF